ncbi:MAG: hypothetical protein F6K50_37770 [Moorea sp. SIO3I7]|uniref:hypothetical protein n=1 Tax=Moorena sp. SIO3I8 TaxID=2607833 RepID=UPI0013BFAF7E|nr:hypothetical protein [Moorena sp. SIO3I8]NEO00966.1 hypothetical protein [Moorena sp. SIO3I7]NEO06444.1 hypothetical protein [Moorena sp. SIO3I8]
MKKIISCFLSLGLILVVILGALPSKAMASENQLSQFQQSTKAVVLAEIPQPPKEPLEEDQGISAAATVSACSLCFTCGGSWPIYSGTIGKIAPASSLTPKERGGSCSGSLEYRDDDHPYLCCRAQ